MTELLVECPECGKRSIVQRNPDRYQCLSCSFSKDLAEGKQQKLPNDLLWVVLMAGAIAFLLTWAQVDLFDDSSESDKEARGLAPIPALALNPLQTFNRQG